MKNIVKETQEIEVVESVTCNKCGKIIKVNNPDSKSDDWIEIQEMFGYTSHCGYGSVFGDGFIYTVELCQTCWKEIIMPYVKEYVYEEEDNDEN